MTSGSSLAIKECKGPWVSQRQLQRWAGDYQGTRLKGDQNSKAMGSMICRVAVRIIVILVGSY